MSIFTKTTGQAVAQNRPMPRVWKTPTSRACWLWLSFSLLLYLVIFALYLAAIKTQAFPGPFNQPLLSFGIVAFVLVLALARTPCAAALRGGCREKPRTGSGCTRG